MSQRERKWHQVYVNKRLVVIESTVAVSDGRQLSHYDGDGFQAVAATGFRSFVLRQDVHLRLLTRQVRSAKRAAGPRR